MGVVNSILCRREKADACRGGGISWGVLEKSRALFAKSSLVFGENALLFRAISEGLSCPWPEVSDSLHALDEGRGVRGDCGVRRKSLSEEVVFRKAWASYYPKRRASLSMFATRNDPPMRDLLTIIPFSSIV